MTEKLVLTAYRQKATTAYSSLDFSILDSHATSPAELHPLQVAEYREIWDKILVPDASSTSEDQTMVASLTWSLGWLLRLYKDDFPTTMPHP